MNDAEILDSLLALARDVGLEVRVVRPRADADALPSSGLCRVRGAVWIVLSTADPVGAQLDVLCAALRAHAAPELEDRYLPPAVRARLQQGAA